MAVDKAKLRRASIHESIHPLMIATAISEFSRRFYSGFNSRYQVRDTCRCS